MKRLTFVLYAALLAPAALAQTTPALPALSTNVTISPEQTSVAAVAQAITKQTGARILLGPEVGGQPALSLTDVPLETALALIAKTTENSWSRIVLPTDKAATLTADQAVALVAAADVLSSGAASVRSTGGKDVAVVATPMKKTDGMSVVYLIRTTKDVAAIEAARAAAEKQAKDDAIAANTDLSSDAKKDPAVVSAYSTLHNLNPDQLAVVTREFIMRMTPDEQKVVGEAMAKQRGKMEELRNQQ